MQRRAQDNGHGLAWFMTSADVCCPRCGNHAVVRAATVDDVSRTLAGPGRLSCAHCGLSRVQTLPDGYTSCFAAYRGPRDPFFGLPLWLSTATRHGVLYAYNRQHLDALHGFVRATLRERTGLGADQLRNATMIARLPRWVKSATNRGEVLKAIDRLYQK